MGLRDGEIKSAEEGSVGMVLSASKLVTVVSEYTAVTGYFIAWCEVFVVIRARYLLAEIMQ